MTHEEIKEKYKDCKLCSNCSNTVKVFGHGNLKAKIAVVGEGPGNDEITHLVPFVGPAGQLLNKILLAIGLKRADIYFTNAILCRTDESNRTPTMEEHRNCRKRLFEELSIVQPMFTLLTGSTALKAVMGESYKISDCHGQWYTTLSNPCFFYFPIMHPAWILHSVNEGETKAKKMTMWNDIRKFYEDILTIEQCKSGETT